MAGLAPAIHVLLAATSWRRGCPARGRAWRYKYHNRSKCACQIGRGSPTSML